MKINKEFFKRDCFRKICGKISNFTVNKGIGFKAVNTINIDEITYVFGIKVKHETIKNIQVDETILFNVINNVPVISKNPKRVVVKGFLKGKGVN